MHNIAYDMFSVLAASMIFTLVFLVLYAMEKRKYLLYWGTSWFMFSAAVSFRFAAEFGMTFVDSVFLDLSTNYISTWFLLLGSLKFVRGTSTKTANFTLGIVYLIIAFTYYTAGSTDFINYVVFLVTAAIFIFSGLTLYRNTHKFSTGGKIAGVLMVLWGLHKANYPFVSDIGWVAPLGYQVAVILTLVTASGIILMHFEKTKKDMNSRELVFSNLAEASRDIVFFVNFTPAMELRYISPSVERITGYSQEEVQNSVQLQDMIIMDFLKSELSSDLHNAKSGELSGTIETASKTGKKIMLNISCTVYSGMDGSVDRAIGFAKDITDDILDFETLVDRHDWYEALFQKSYSMQMLISGKTGMIADANNSFSSFIGYSIQELRSMFFSGLFEDENEAEIFRANRSRLLEPARYRLKSRNGRVKDVLVSASELEFSSKNYFYLTMDDLSSEIHFERELNNIATLHRAILESLNEGVIGLNEQGHIFFVNSFAADLLGYGQAELIGKDHHETIHYKNDCGSLKIENCPIIGAIRNDSQLLNHRDIFVKKTGEIFHVELTLGQLRYFNNEQKCIIVFRDITSELEGESRMLQQIDENKVLLQEVHHRVKNNLQIISSLLSLQKDYMQTDTGKTPLNDSIARIKSMALIHELLYQTNGLSSLSLKQYLEKLVFDLHSMLAQSDDIHVTTSIDEVFISLDNAVPYGLIVTELFTNSIKHAFKDFDGVKVIEVGFKSGQDSRLWVKDTGRGISEDKKSSQSSFGMTVINSLVKQLGGTISYDSSNGLAVTIDIKNTQTVEPLK